MTVAKFGGSSLADANGFARVKEIIKENDIPIVIASAPGGKEKITDMLIAAYNEWERTGSCDGRYGLIGERFLSIAAAFGIDIERSLAAIKAAINSGRGYDYAVSRGEFLSARILAEILGYNFVDARECVKLTLSGEIDFASIIAHSGAIKVPCVIPGFYGKMPNGEIKLLPRGGSDISGAAIAAAIKGDYMKWTDVDGIFDGHGGVIDHLGYDEAELLCYFGATVMQYEAIPLIKRADVPLTVKNTFSHSRGTVVGKMRCDGFAFSSRRFFEGGEEAYAHVDEIAGEGLKIPFRVSLLKERKVLIDDCGFSPLALKRILRYGGLKQVTVTAAIGNVPPSFMPGDLLFSGENGKIFVDDRDL